MKQFQNVKRVAIIYEKYQVGTIHKNKPPPPINRTVSVMFIR